MKPTYRIYIGDALTVLKTLPSESVHCCVTSPPFWRLRDYGVDGQIGLEDNLDEYLNKLVQVFREVRRVLRSDGTLWLNIGDTYISSGFSVRQNNRSVDSPTAKNYRSTARLVDGLKPKDLAGAPWRLALALQKDGWYLRSDIIWAKPNPMPESVKDRPTLAHEYLFLLSKSKHYYYDVDAIREPVKAASLRKRHSPWAGPRYRDDPRGNANNLRPEQSCHPKGKNKRTIWWLSTEPFKGNHFSTFPKKLVEPCILAGSPLGGTVLDPFVGSGTTIEVGRRLGRQSIGIEINDSYRPLIERRVDKI